MSGSPVWLYAPTLARFHRSPAGRDHPAGTVSDLSREPAVVDALLGLLRNAHRSDARYDRYVNALVAQLADPAEAEAGRLRLAFERAGVVEVDAQVRSE